MQPAPLLSCCLFFHVGCSDFLFCSNAGFWTVLELLELASGSLDHIPEGPLTTPGQKGVPRQELTSFSSLPLRPTISSTYRFLPHFGYPSHNTQQPAFCFFAFFCGFLLYCFCFGFPGTSERINLCFFR